MPLRAVAVTKRGRRSRELSPLLLVQLRASDALLDELRLEVGDQRKLAKHEATIGGRVVDPPVHSHHDCSRIASVVWVSCLQQSLDISWLTYEAIDLRRDHRTDLGCLEVRKHALELWPNEATTPAPSSRGGAKLLVDADAPRPARARVL